MVAVKTRMKPELYERMKHDMGRSRRGVQAEIEYLVTRGLEIVEAEEKILAGRSQLDPSFFQGAQG